VPEGIHRAAVDFGMPVGPLELLDEVGLDIAAHAAASLEAAYGERMGTSQVLAGLVARKELGRKTGRGIYVWERGRDGRPAKRGRNPALPPPASGAAAGLSRADVQDRLILAMVAEAARCLEARVVSGPRELDLASVFGLGFAPFRGGIWRHAHALGLPAVAARLEQLAAMPDVASRPGGPERYAPSEFMLAVSGARSD
jgi:3-hydroxyacyl-CoA dehydrogenase/enoyl-CoA hydratase/3-hydroxybutyryl-CoA epimerase